MSIGARACGKADHWRVADEGPSDGDDGRISCVSRCSTPGTSHPPQNLGAQLLLGMSELTAAAFRARDLNSLPALVAGEAVTPDRAMVRAAAPIGPLWWAPRRAPTRRGCAAYSCSGCNWRPRRACRSTAAAEASRLAGQQVAAGASRRFSLRGSYASPRPSPTHQDLQERHQGSQGHRSRGRRG